MKGNNKIMDIIHEAKTMLELAVHHLERCGYDTDCFKITIEKLKKEMKVKNINNDVVLGVSLPDQETINKRIVEQEQYHLRGMKGQYTDFVPIEFAATCCGNSFDDAIRWIKEKS